jgi:hypothetical protein
VNINKCVWTSGVPFSFTRNYKRIEKTTNPGWHVSDGINVKGGELARVDFNINDLLVTKDNTIISVKSPMYCSDRKGPVEVDFWIKQGGYKTSDSRRGYAVYYDKNLKNIAGNHREGDSNLDIVGVFKGELEKRCPHCGEIL